MKLLTPGRPFVSLLFDYSFVAGGLAIAVSVWLWAGRPADLSLLRSGLVPLFLLANFAHFGASTVRLYTKPKAFEQFPGLTFVLPIASFGLVALVIAHAARFGRLFNGLYLTWSPFHYAAQTFGLCVWYAMRSGFELGPADRRVLYWSSLLPFLYSFFSGVHADLGLGLLVRGNAVFGWADPLCRLIAVLTFAAPVLLVLGARAAGRGPVPGFIPVLLVSNGLFWTLLGTLNAFFLATIFHGLQYLAVVLFADAEDRRREGTPALPSALRFYAASTALGYALFRLWPFAFAAAGYGLAESLVIVTAAINIHHFFVDGFIWRLRPSA